MGVPTVWIVDPEERLVYILNADGTSQTQAEGTLRLAGSRIELALPEIFSILDETGDATDATDPNASQS